MSRQTFYEKLEITKILHQLEEIAILPPVKQAIHTMNEERNIEQLEKVLTRVDEALKIIYRYDRAPFLIASDYYLLLNITQKGGILSGAELYETVRLFSTIHANQKLAIQLGKEHIDAEYYVTLVGQLYIINELAKELQQTIDDTGFILDDATPTLK